MSRLYPEARKKPEKKKVTCLTCQNIAIYDKKPNSWCYAYSKNITDEEVVEERHCRKHTP